ncbi:aromatic ring-hydroxylating dioxygenase subunit alpha [Bradyrhizobium jicamae]|uniref:aromatic ring-hydroxylating dioxygenase subunit alpha n=1 Tax=Bradyrhizobium jicamae TaxID=280332 RepID=UPI001BA55E0E|nr:aromatic ring-hydroxylating dioxygenase subunit alpha [Bradyrhizobium jicamae]MBR0755287.1 aromatic ring-hydroxylating dioxygenase subunit alpha [Bradyrhizobium jicamae]
MIFQRNVWYVAAKSEDVDRQLRRRTILNEPVLLYRTERGEVAAMQDLCPHRFAPLSRGTLFGDIVQCKYHGLRFDALGRCVHNPHGDVITQRMHVRRYPTAERHGFIWIWMGDSAQAEPERIPDLSYMDAPGTRTVHSYIKANYRYDILVDNLLDLSHAEYLHVGSFSAGPAACSKTSVNEERNDVFVVRTMQDGPSLPHLAHLGERIDQTLNIHWRPGQVMNFEIKSTPVGDPSSNGHRARFSHIATPETEGTTHYFMSTTRDYAIDDPKVDAEAALRQVTVIQNEDGPMLDAINAEMHGMELMDMGPVLLPVDVGAIRVRRVMKRLIDEEISGSQNSVSATRSR